MAIMCDYVSSKRASDSIGSTSSLLEVVEWSLGRLLAYIDRDWRGSVGSLPSPAAAPTARYLGTLGSSSSSRGPSLLRLFCE